MALKQRQADNRDGSGVKTVAIRTTVDKLNGQTLIHVTKRQAFLVTRLRRRQERTSEHATMDDGNWDLISGQPGNQVEYCESNWKSFNLLLYFVIKEKIEFLQQVK